MAPRDGAGLARYVTLLAHDRSRASLRTFHIVKEQVGPDSKIRAASARAETENHPTTSLPAGARLCEDGFGSPFGNRAGWWSQAGSNRRPPACKADALPAELWPHTLVGLGGLEPPTSPLSGVRSNRLSYRPALGCDLQVIGGGSQFGQTTR